MRNSVRSILNFLYSIFSISIVLLSIFYVTPLFGYTFVEGVKTHLFLVLIFQLTVYGARCFVDDFLSVFYDGDELVGEWVSPSEKKNIKRNETISRILESKL